MKLAVRFSSKDTRNAFVKLFAQNVPGPGYGYGMEFEGLEYGLESDHATGRIVRHRGMKGAAAGEWELSSTGVRLDLGYIAHVDPHAADLMRARMRDVAASFGGEQVF